MLLGDPVEAQSRILDLIRAAQYRFIRPHLVADDDVLGRTTQSRWFGLLFIDALLYAIQWHFRALNQLVRGLETLHPGMDYDRHKLTPALLGAVFALGEAVPSEARGSSVSAPLASLLRVCVAALHPSAIPRLARAQRKRGALRLYTILVVTNHRICGAAST